MSDKQKREESKHDKQGNLVWQADYDINGNKIAVSHYNATGLIRRERYDTQGNLIGIYHFDGKGLLVKYVPKE